MAVWQSWYQCWSDQRLLYAGLGYYWDGRPYQCLTAGAKHLYQSNQPPRSTQPGHLSVGRRNEYRPKSGDALLLEVNIDMVLFADNTV